MIEKNNINWCETCKNTGVVTYYSEDNQADVTCPDCRGIKKMSFSEYEEEAKKTANYNESIMDMKVVSLRRASHLSYIGLGLAGEAGEVANIIKKVIRDDEGNLTTEKRQKILDELSDCLWYIAMGATEIGSSLEEIADHNVKKLQKRYESGKDNRIEERLQAPVCEECLSEMDMEAGVDFEGSLFMSVFCPECAEAYDGIEFFSVDQVKDFIIKNI